jgi:hypothetical protein
MIIDGTYRDEIDKYKNEKKIVYKFVPRAMYDDVFIAGTKEPLYTSMFEDSFSHRGLGLY